MLYLKMFAQADFDFESDGNNFYHENVKQIEDNGNLP